MLQCARAEQKPLLLMFGANWCPWCRELDRMLARDKDLSRLADETFLRLMDIGRYDRNLALAADYGLTTLDDTGIPCSLCCVRTVRCRPSRIRRISLWARVMPGARFGVPTVLRKTLTRGADLAPQRGALLRALAANSRGAPGTQDAVAARCLGDALRIPALPTPVCRRALGLPQTDSGVSPTS